jgi:hypothetical protein
VQIAEFRKKLPKGIIVRESLDGMSFRRDSDELAGETWVKKPEPSSSVP